MNEIKELLVRIFPARGSAILLQDLVVETSVGFVTVPEGFETDFASIPQIFQSAVPKFGKHMIAAIIHDYFYRVSDARTFFMVNNVVSKLTATVVTRAIADKIFLEEMKDSGVALWKRTAMYVAVRVGGGSSWKE